MQFVHVTLLGRLRLVLPSIRFPMLLMVSGPVYVWILVRVSVMQFVLPSFKQTTCLIVG